MFSAGNVARACARSCAYSPSKRLRRAAPSVVSFSFSTADAATGFSGCVNVIVGLLALGGGYLCGRKKLGYVVDDFCAGQTRFCSHPLVGYRFDEAHDTVTPGRCA